MGRQIHVFDNGVRIFDDHLIPVQRERYRKRNVHEAEEEDIFIELIRSLPSNGCFVDIGAAVGYYLILAKRLAPGLTVHAVEPLERHRRFLLENLALNGLSDSDVTIHDEGISSSPGTENFLDWGYGSRLRRAEKENKPSLSMRWRAMLVLLGIGKKESSKAVVPIRTITLDTLLDRIDRIVDLVQMDVQGLEVEVLEGGVHSMETARVQAYLIGTHSLKIHRECSAILEEHGYVIEFDKSDTKDQPDGILVAKRKS